MKKALAIVLVLVFALSMVACQQEVAEPENSAAPTAEATVEPTVEATVEATVEPTVEATVEATVEPEATAAA
ncbi:MAG: hypothetical protein IJO48_06365 [Clostridia bacterium]|nr:hypothetical protein [Clostridia bacterium]